MPSADSSSDDPIPTYRIDLGLPPEQRYVQVAADFAERLRSVRPILDEVLEVYLQHRWLCAFVKLAFRLLLWRVRDDEQTREIRSIAAVAGVELYLLVALNTLLDCLLGCTSGAVTVRGGRDRASPGHLMHFRTLDWRMPPLRRLLVVLEFVDSRAADPQAVLARSITYAGFVGVLTGVRPGFSLSLNFRPMMAQLARHQILHMLLVVFGFRESISSTLRNVILSPSLPIATAPGDKSSLVEFARSFAATPSPRCYLVFATPREAVVVQKDFDTAKITHGDEFIAQANHDVDHTLCCAGSRGTKIRADQVLPTNLLGGEIWLEESIERQDVLRRQWVAHTHRGGSSSAGKVKVNGASNTINGEGKAEFGGTCVDTVASLEAEASGENRTSQKRAPGITRQTLERWLTTYPVSNECTHFAAIMDPMRGTIVFLQRGPEELEHEA